MSRGENPPAKGPKRSVRKKERPGLPNASSVVEEGTLTSPMGRRYRVIRTTEKDPYDKESSDAGKR
jgi:hypothetical protein